MAGRCKACNKILSESEIIWNEDAQLHEELCRRCRNAVHKDLGTGVSKELDAMENVVYLEDLLDDSEPFDDEY